MPLVSKTKPNQLKIIGAEKAAKSAYSGNKKSILLANE